ncbi:MAG: hypothetical protein E7812_02235 [Phenylobacterium sp.]|nr:MAG: hypothetical protein E7812_02235 [Phenylobacterium sp.]
MDFACTQTARTLFLTSAGADGIPLARLVALLRTVMILNPVAAQRRLDVARVVPGGLGDFRQIAGSFAELDASGMREADVMLELLGRPGADGPARPGVFERAILLNGRRTDDVVLTGGFVHVAAPADLTGPAQVALAGLAGGAIFPPVGGSEEGEDFLAFDGVSIFTTRRISAYDGLRPDVAARLAGRDIAVPRLSELMPEFDLQVAAALGRIRHEHDLMNARFELSSDAARDYWKANGPPARLPQEAIAILRTVDWAHHGEAEGLLQALRQIVSGVAPATAVAGLTQSSPAVRSDPADALLRRLETLAGHDDKKLAGRIRVVELETRAALKTRLRSDRAALTRLARKLGVSVDVVATQAAQIDRTRTNGEAEGDE